LVQKPELETIAEVIVFWDKISGSSSVRGFVIGSKISALGASEVILSSKKRRAR
jgi:hypothetical protein